MCVDSQRANTSMALKEMDSNKEPSFGGRPLQISLLALADLVATDANWPSLPNSGFAPSGVQTGYLHTYATPGGPDARC